MKKIIIKKNKMKHILYRLIFIIFIFLLFCTKNIKGKKAIINYASNHLINSIRIEPNKKELFLFYPLTGKGNFVLDCEPGDKIITNIIVKGNNPKNKNYFSMIIKFEDNTTYFFNKNNISIHNIYNNKNIDFFFYIPYETYCKNKNDIIIYNRSETIKFDFLSI